MRVLIVDDEPLARAVLREYLAPEPGVEIVGECADGFEAVRAITDLSPDIVFLDIQMPRLTGFDVLELLEQRPAVIFVTAYDSFAIRAFDVHAVDYLLKPFSRDRLREALAHARGTTDRSGIEHLLGEIRRTSAPIERILVRDGASVHVIPVGQVDHIDAQDDYVMIYSGGKKYLKLQRLAELEGALDSRRFIRIHRSHILNIERLSRLETYARDSRIAVLTDGTKLPVSRSGYDRLRVLL